MIPTTRPQMGPALKQTAVTMFWCKVTRAFTQAVNDCFGPPVHAGCGLAYPKLQLAISTSAEECEE